jgi:hypothetical protein
MLPSHGCDDWRAQLEREHEMRVEEGMFVESERQRVQARLGDVPEDPQAFVAWFEALEADGPGQGDALFDWLANDASRSEMTWFLRQELVGEAGFDDLVALTQVRMPLRPKLELARNYWDEMGRGHRSAVHARMLEELGDALCGADVEPVWESLALANLMSALACNRALAYQSIGALGAIELTAPGRAVRVHAGLRRLGFEGRTRRYFAVHATLDVKHSRAWNDEVLAPLIRSDPRVAPRIAEGALLRLAAGARCFERYRRALGLS